MVSEGVQSFSAVQAKKTQGQQGAVKTQYIGYLGCTIM